MSSKFDKETYPLQFTLKEWTNYLAAMTAMLAARECGCREVKPEHFANYTSLMETMADMLIYYLSEKK
jgi:hypothetical protein